MLSSRDAFGTSRRTDAIVPCGAAIFIIRKHGPAVCSKAYSRSGFARRARDARRCSRRASVAMCGSTHRRGRCLFIIDSSWRRAAKRGRRTSRTNRARDRRLRVHDGRSCMTAPGTGSSSIASRRPVHEASRRFIWNRAHLRGAHVRPAVCCRLRACMAVAICGASASVRTARVIRSGEKGWPSCCTARRVCRRAAFTPIGGNSPKSAGATRRR